MHTRGIRRRFGGTRSRPFVEGALPMKNLLEVLRMKEQEILRVKQEIEALQTRLPTS
jgi:hypothetical protein